MRKEKFAATLVILAALIMAANGGANPLVDPAVLVTRADAEAALGTSVEEPAMTTNPMGQRILHHSAAAQGTKVRFLQISVSQTAAMPEKMIRNGK